MNTTVNPAIREGPPRAKSVPRSRRVVVRRAVLGLALLAGAAAAVHGAGYRVAGQYLRFTEAARVKGDDAIAASVAGEAARRSDAPDFGPAADRAHADVMAARATVRNLDARIALQRSVIARAKAELAASMAAVAFAREEDVRYRTPTRNGYGTTRRSVQADMLLRQNEAQLERDRAALAAARRRIDVLSAERARAVGKLGRSMAAKHGPRSGLSRNSVAAPVDHPVGARSPGLAESVRSGPRPAPAGASGAGRSD